MLCADLIAPEGYGEIIGGSERIHDMELLKRVLKNMDWILTRINGMLNLENMDQFLIPASALD